MEKMCERLFELAAPYLAARGNREHMEMAFAFAVKLQQMLGGRKEIIFPAIILHDVGGSTIAEGQHGQAFGPGSDLEMNRLHETEGAKIAAALLQQVPLSQADREEICRIIESHDSGQNPLTLEEKIVKDADKLFRFTAQGFAFVAYHIGCRRFIVYMKKVVVVGAGPAGLMAAAVAAEQGAQVILLEKMAGVGTKLSITGNGRCNLTANVENSDLIKGIPGNGRFLYSAFQQFSNTDLREFLHSRGLPTKVEGKRVFPMSDKAKDVVELLSKNARQTGVEIILSHKVSAIEISDLKLKHVLPMQVKSDRGCLSAAAVIIATGGMSYPSTGSSGDGYAWAEKLGHHIVSPRPALVPLVVKEIWIRELQGLSLGEVKAGAYTDTGKLINEDFGELLFTHYGLSGPLILSLSHAVGAYLYQQQRPAIISLDLKPSLQAEALDVQLLDLLSRNGRKMLKNALEDLLPPKLIPVITRLSGLQAEKECHQVTRAQRLELVRLLKHFSMTVRATRPLAEAIVTAGGVDVKEVNPKTMESRLVKGIYFAGEILDVDGYTGGYNLQAAFSSGYVAGKNAAR